MRRTLNDSNDSNYLSIDQYAKEDSRVKNRTRFATIAGMFACVCLLSSTAFAGECEGDVNGDGQVNIGDIIGVIIDYGCESKCTGDANGDGVVDFMDILLVIENFGCGVTQCETNEDCDDGDPCTRDFCTPFGCISIPIDCD